MAFCTNCGTQLDEGIAFCINCGNAVMGDSANQSAQQPRMFEEFIPTLGLGKRFVFTENSLIFGNEEYAYSQLNPITILSAATTPLTNGVANTVTENE